MQGSFLQGLKWGLNLLLPILKLCNYGFGKIFEIQEPLGLVQKLGKVSMHMLHTPVC